MLPMLGFCRSPDRRISFRPSASAGRTLEAEINAESRALVVAEALLTPVEPLVAIAAADRGSRGTLG